MTQTLEELVVDADFAKSLAAFEQWWLNYDDYAQDPRTIALAAWVNARKYEQSLP